MSFATRAHFALPSELSGQAIDGKGDTHLAAGIHVRFAPAPELGLPIEPLQVVRLTLGPGKQWPGLRTDIVWIDAGGNYITPPFKVVPGSIVRGYLPKLGGATCCWLRLSATVTGVVGPSFNPFVLSRSLSGTAPRSRTGILGSAAAAAIATRRDIRGPITNIQSTLTLRAFMNTEMGPAEVARRTEAEFEVAATPIDWIELSGTATVHGVQWLDARAVFDEFVDRGQLPAQNPQSLSVWRSLSMPVANAVRYTGAPPNSEAQAAARVKEGAPTHFGLHDDPSVSKPAASPPATTIDEETRLADITPELRTYLKHLVNTLTPHNLTEEVPIPPAGSFEISLLDAVLHALSDPSVARWTGHAVVDPAPPSATKGDLIAYAVLGSWLLPGEERAKRLGTVMCAVLRYPGDRPSPPTIDQPVSGSFMPDTPPAAHRLVKLHFRDLVIGGGLAVARRIGSFVQGLNKRAPSGRAIPFLPGIDDESFVFGEASITDGNAPPEALVYRAAQQDWFGRWSEWAERKAAAAVRPLPPAPVLNAVYHVPDVPTPIPNGLLSGTISFEVPVPPIASLPTGGFLLDHLELQVDSAVRNFPNNPTNPPSAIASDILGPGIERCGQRTVVLIAYWIDQAGQRSAPSNPKTLVMNDPRPAPAVTFPPGLRYTARPDAMGQARFQLQWISGPGQSFFRVFYSNETRLLRGLANLAEGGGPQATAAAGVLAQLAAETDFAVRAEIFDDHGALFDRHLFEQITTQPIPATSSGAVVTVNHAVSGALQVLSFYRVVSVTQAQVESKFESASIVPVRVPNSLTPSRPILSIRPTTDPVTGAFVAELTVSVPLGNIPASEYRIRRSVQGALDVNAMPVIAGGPIESTADGRGRAVYLDQGPATAGGALLQPWLRYVWRAEVRGLSEPGAGPGADWSQPSAPVAHMFVPPEPPPPPELLGLSAVPGVEAELRFTHPDPLRGAVGQGYALEVYRQLPGQRASLLRTIDAGSPATEGGRDAAGEFHVIDADDPPLATAYSVIVRDPLGRRSRATAPAFVTEAPDG